MFYQKGGEGKFYICHHLKWISQLYSATRPGACEELKLRAVHRSVRSGVEYGYLYVDICVLMMIIIIMTMVVMVV